MAVPTWSGCRNVRDVGGFTAADGRTVQERRLVRSDCLDRLDDDGRADAPPGAVLVHCHAGKDRTGMLVALLLDLVGVDRDVIAEHYARSEALLGIRDRIAMLDTDADREEAETFWRTLPDTITSTLKHLDAEYGGTEDSLRDACGLTDDEIQSARDRLVASGARAGSAPAQRPVIAAQVPNGSSYEEESAAGWVRCRHSESAGHEQRAHAPDRRCLRPVDPDAGHR